MYALPHPARLGATADNPVALPTAVLPLLLLVLHDHVSLLCTDVAQPALRYFYPRFIWWFVFIPLYCQSHLHRGVQQTSRERKVACKHEEARSDEPGNFSDGRIDPCGSVYVLRGTMVPFPQIHDQPANRDAG